jgi:transcriptional regulator with XRE-family HTH domain
VAKLLKVTPYTVTGWELKRHVPPARLAKKIICFLGYVPPNNKQSSLGEKLRQARQILGHTQEQTARRLCCDESNIRLIELGERNPRMKTFKKIERYICQAEEKFTGLRP